MPPNILNPSNMTTIGTDPVTEEEEGTEGSEVAVGSKIGSTGLSVLTGDLTPGLSSLITPGVSVVNTVTNGNFPGTPTRAVANTSADRPCRK